MQNSILYLPLSVKSKQLFVSSPMCRRQQLNTTNNDSLSRPSLANSTWPFSSIISFQGKDRTCVLKRLRGSLLKIINYFHSNAFTAVAGNKSKRFYYYFYYYYYYCYLIATLSYYCPFALFCCLFLLSLFNQCLINVAGIINSTLVLAWPGSNHELQSPTLLLKWLSHESSFRSDNPIS